MVENQLPKEIWNNRFIKADTINHATDFRTLPELGEQGVNLEYLKMIQVLGEELCHNYQDIQNGTFDLIHGSSYLEYGKPKLDLGSDPRIKILNDSPKTEIIKAIDNNLKSQHDNRGDTSLDKGNP